MTTCYLSLEDFTLEEAYNLYYSKGIIIICNFDENYPFVEYRKGE